MKKTLLVVNFLLTVVVLSGCGLLGSFKRHPDTVKPLLFSYAGPKARLAIGDFYIRAAKVNKEISSGLRQILVTALINSNRFLITDSASDIAITVVITEFEPQMSGGIAGVGGGGGVGDGNFGGLLGRPLNKAHMSLDMLAFDVLNSRVLASIQVRGEAQDASGVIIQGIEKQGLNNALPAYADASMEKAIRICISESVERIIKAIPAEYYKN